LAGYYSIVLLASQGGGLMCVFTVWVRCLAAEGAVRQAQPAQVGAASGTGYAAV
jgi:hypothetical protein